MAQLRQSSWITGATALELPDLTGVYGEKGMHMKGLPGFLVFDLKRFLTGKTLSFIKVTPWIEDSKELGSKVTTQIVEDKTKYLQADAENFGELLVVKVRGVAPIDFSEWIPFETEVAITNVEKAVVYGEYRNQLSIIATVTAKGAH